MSQKRSNSIRSAAFAALEMLEQRRLLSTTVQFFTTDNGDGTNTLEIVGTKNKDSIDVYDDPANKTITVKDNKTNNETEFGYDDSDYINVVHIDAKQGDDTVVYELVSSYDGDRRSIEADLSDGNDKFTFVSPTENTSVGDNEDVNPTGADIVDGSRINIEVEGQEKNDTIDIDLTNTSIVSSEVTVNVDAGTGNDKVYFEAPFFGFEEGVGVFDQQQSVTNGAIPAQTPDEGSGFSQLQVQIDLGSGTNLYTQDMSVDVSDADITVNVNGGSGKDTIQDTENFQLLEGSNYSFTANLGAGNDYYNGEYDFSDEGIDIDEGSSATINLQGGDGNDRMTVEGDDEVAATVKGVTPAEAPDDFISGKFTVLAYGGNGNDTLDMFSDTNHALYIDTDEDAQVRVVLSGDYGNDDVRLFLGAPQGSDGDYDLSVLGAAGKDTVGAGFADETFEVLSTLPGGLAKPAIPVDIESNVTFGPAGAILLDGGRDSDKWDVESYTFLGEFVTPFSVRAVETSNEAILPDLPDVV